jgi:hypothetical protein
MNRTLKMCIDLHSYSKLSLSCTAQVWPAEAFYADVAQILWHLKRSGARLIVFWKFMPNIILLIMLWKFCNQLLADVVCIQFKIDIFNLTFQINFTFCVNDLSGEMTSLVQFHKLFF